MSTCSFIELDIHKNLIAYCITTSDGRLIDQGEVVAVACKQNWANIFPVRLLQETLKRFFLKSDQDEQHARDEIPSKWHLAGFYPARL